MSVKQKMKIKKNVGRDISLENQRSNHNIVKKTITNFNTRIYISKKRDDDSLKKK